MNFFEHQDQAQQNTRRLMGLFALSIATMIVAIYCAAVIVFNLTSLSSPSSGCRGWRISLFGTSRRSCNNPLTSSLPHFDTSSWWNPNLFFWVAIVTIIVIAIASLYKISSLQQGGSVIAQELGGRLLLAEIANVDERQLLNIVEEMAIAANIPPPAVYLLDNESGINALAAGFTPKNAVIGVTRGCLQQLTRDELQGVIGHEFSHILNGDMRLNLRLVGILHGILFVYIIGRLMIESEDSNHSWLWYFGLALMAIGSLGLLFGRLIKSAVSRQREFLADASAVQFTRNPDGIAGALQKIGSVGSRLQSPYAESSSHMFFGSALKFTSLEDLLATHPPIRQRLRRLGGLNVAQISTSASGSASHDSLVMGFAGSSGVLPLVNVVRSKPIAYPESLLAQMSEPLQSGIQEREGAIALVYTLLLDPKNLQARSQQVEWLRQIEPEISQQMLAFHPQIEQLAVRDRLPFLDLAVPALLQNSAAQCQQLFNCVQGLAKVDNRWSLTEFVILVILQTHLQPCLGKVVKSEQFSTLDPIWSDCIVVVSALAQVGQTDSDAIVYALRSGLFRLPGAGQQTMPKLPPNWNFSELRKSLNRLSVASLKLRQAIVETCSYTVLLDNTVTDQEAELLRAIVIVLNCPLPPFLNSLAKQSRKLSKTP